MVDMNAGNGSEMRSRERPEVVRKRKRRRIVWTVVIIFVLVAVGGMVRTAKKAKAMLEDMVWEERTVESGDVEIVVSQTGIVEPMTQVIVKSQVAAEVLGILVNEGDYVSEGDVIAKLDESRIRQDVDNQAAQVDSALAGVERASLLLSKTESLTGAQLSSARAALDSAHAALSISVEGQRPEEIVQAEQRVTQAQANLTASEAQLQELKVGYRPQEIAEQEQSVTQAESQLAQAETALSRMLAGNRSQEVEQARAELEQTEMSEASAQAALRKLEVGARPQEIAQAQLEESEVTLSRQVELKDAGHASQQAVDTARSTYLAARAQAESRQQALSLLQEGTREEDLAAARADLARAQAGTAASRQRLDLIEAGARVEDIEEQRQAVRAAQASLASAQARLDLMREGTRDEQIRQQEAAVQGAESSLREAEAALRLARIGARPQEIIQAESALQEAEAGLEQAQAGGLDPAVGTQDIVQARAQLQAAQTMLLRAQEDLQDCTIRSPISGVVLSRHIEAGELAASGTSGLSAGTPLVTVGDSDQLVVKLQIHEVDVVDLKADLRAEIRFDSVQGKVFTGRVHEIAPQSTAVNQAQAAGSTEGPAEPGVATFEVRILVEDADPRIRPGMSARVTVTCDSVSDVPVVTLAALRTEGDDTYVLLPSGEPLGEPIHQTVELGMRGNSTVEIKSGLQPGDVYLIKKPDTAFELRGPH